MFSIRIGGLDQFISGLNTMARDQVPFARSRALNDVADDIQAAEVHEIADSFDRPKPLTLNSVYVRRSTKRNLVATIGIKDFAGKGNPASKYLAAEVYGGTRVAKRFERALQSAGLMQSGYIAVPGGGVQLDAYGNVPASLIVQLLAYFKAFPEMGYRANMTDKRKASLARTRKGKQGVAYFVARDTWLHPGIWARYTFAHGSAVKPILLFVRGADYEKRFDFFYAAELTARRMFGERFLVRWSEALASARLR